MRTGTYKFGKWIPDNLTLVSLQEEETVEIDVEYRPLKGIFAASNFNDEPLKLNFEEKNDGVEGNLKK